MKKLDDESGGALETRAGPPSKAARAEGRLGVSSLALAGICRRRRIRRLALFGSVLRPDFGPESDVDILVEFEPGATPGFFGLVRIEEELSRLLGGRKVDLRTPQDLSPYFRNEVVASADVRYGGS